MGFHFYLGHCKKQFAQGKNLRAPLFYRVLNELPTVLLVGIVILVVVKPF